MTLRLRWTPSAGRVLDAPSALAELLLHRQLCRSVNGDPNVGQVYLSPRPSSLEGSKVKVDGRCHCGWISYEAEIDPEKVMICHCTDCQTLSGSAFRMVAFTRENISVAVW
jgi:hypothetical protein